MAIDVNVQKTLGNFFLDLSFSSAGGVLGCVGLREEQDAAMHCRH